MYTRDIVVDELRKTALIIAKLLGLKAGGNHEEFAQEFNKTLLKEYNIELENLLALNLEEFNDLVKSEKFSAEKLNALGQLLNVFAEPFKQDEETQLLLKKMLAIFDILEEKYHYQSFDNITKRNFIYKYFNTTYEG